MQQNVKKGVIPVTNALNDLGLTQDILREAIEQGEIARASCTANDPPCVPGIYSWGSTVRSLRDILIPQPYEWTKSDDGNYSTVISPDGSFQIAVVTGDLGTGLADHNPTSKYPKGPKTQDAVHANEQFLLFPEDQKAAEEKAAKQEAADKRITWILLKRRSSDLVFAELSLPKTISNSGYVETWQVRIILDPIEVEPIAILDDDAEDEAIEVVVKRR
jgi:hypothetical protein